jgi:DUF2911 family protein
MRKLFGMALGLGVLFSMALNAAAQGNPRGKADLALNGKAISIDYGQPSLKGRTIDDLLGQLKPGQFWRLGADSSTTFESAATLSFGKVTVPAGTYSLWAKKLADNKWNLVFNKQHGQWGTIHDPKQDAYSVPLTESKASDSAEKVTISLTQMGDGGNVSIQWGDLMLKSDFKAK